MNRFSGSKFQAKGGQVVREPMALVFGQWRARLRPFCAFGHPSGENQTGRFLALPAIGLGQKLENFDQLRLSGTLITGFDLISLFPGRIDFPLEPFDDLSGLICFICRAIG